MEHFTSCLQHSRPCCIRNYNSRFRPHILYNNAAHNVNSTTKPSKIHNVENRDAFGFVAPEARIYISYLYYRYHLIMLVEGSN